MQRPPPGRSLIRRAAALGVAVLCVAPFHRLLSPDRNGPGGADALLRAEASWSVTLWGTLVVLLLGIAAAMYARGRVRSATSPGARPSLASRLATVDAAPMALTAATLALLLSCSVALGVYDRLLVSVDEMAQLIHARYLASGQLGATLPAGAEAWAIPNMLVTDVGWTSQYPPGHPLVWSAFVLMGIGWTAGPILFALMVGLLSGSFDRLLSDAHRAQGRMAVLLLAVSPYSLALAGATPSHLTAGAAGALALYAAVRGVEGVRGWAALAGAAMGVMVLARPWTGLVLGPVLTLGVWLERGGPTLARRSLVPWILGGVPSALLLLMYDESLFGSPFVLGYEALYGPAHGLGLHADPWAYRYGLREALAYSSSDLVQLGATLLETPVSVVLVGAAYLVHARSLPRGVAVVAAWALVPVAANAVYWFHAPRMLFEASPAWVLLAVLAVAHALERSGPAIRSGIAVATAAALLVAVPYAITRVASLGWSDETRARIAMPAAEGALVFVHASWDERIASMLQAAGMRNDSIQPILRRNDTCALHLYAVARLDGPGGSGLPGIDAAQTHAPPERARAVSLDGGTRIWRDPAREWPGACMQEAVADRFGSLALAPLVWQGDLPGLESGGPMFVRDFGPQRNRAVMAAFPNRRPLVLGYGGDGDAPALLPYDDAMALLWGGAQPPS